MWKKEGLYGLLDHVKENLTELFLIKIFQINYLLIQYQINLCK